MTTKFRHPDEYSKKKNRVPISARLDKELKATLETVAKKAGYSFGELVENVLEDYLNFLNSNTAKGRKK